MSDVSGMTREGHVRSEKGSGCDSPGLLTKTPRSKNRQLLVERRYPPQPTFVNLAPDVAKVLAEDWIFAPDFCKPKSPVKREVWSTLQKLGFVRLPFLRRSAAPSPDRPLEPEEPGVRGRALTMLGGGEQRSGEYTQTAASFAQGPEG